MRACFDIDIAGDVGTGRRCIDPAIDRQVLAGDQHVAGRTLRVDRAARVDQVIGRAAGVDVARYAHRTVIDRALGDVLRKIGLQQHVAAIGAQHAARLQVDVLLAHQHDVVAVVHQAHRTFGAAAAIDRKRTVQLVGAGTGLDKNGAADVDRMRLDADVITCIDPPVDLDRAVAALELTLEQRLERAGARAAHLRAQAQHLVRTRRCHRQRADVEHASAAHHKSVRRGKEDASADLAGARTLVAVEQAVDRDLLVPDQVDQVAGTGGQVQVHRVARTDAEHVEGVECVTAAQGRRVDRVGRTGDADRGVGLGARIGIERDRRLRRGPARERRAQHRGNRDGQRTTVEASRCGRLTRSCMRRRPGSGVIDTNHGETLGPDDGLVLDAVRQPGQSPGGNF